MIERHEYQQSHGLALKPRNWPESCPVIIPGEINKKWVLTASYDTFWRKLKYNIIRSFAQNRIRVNTYINSKKNNIPFDKAGYLKCVKSKQRTHVCPKGTAPRFDRHCHRLCIGSSTLICYMANTNEWSLSIRIRSNRANSRNRAIIWLNGEKMPENKPVQKNMRYYQFLSANPYSI